MKGNGHKKTEEGLNPGIAVLSTATGGAALGIAVGTAVGGPVGTVTGGVLGALVGAATGVLSRTDSSHEGDGKATPKT